MRSKLCCAAAVLVVAACSSSTEGDNQGGCADIAGNWEVTSKITSSDCPGSGSDTSSLTMRKNADGSWTAIFPAVTGGCPGDLDAHTCKFVSNCDVTSNGAKVGSFGIEWTFSGATLSGSEVGRLLPPVVPKACQEISTDTGKKL